MNKNIDNIMEGILSLKITLSRAWVQPVMTKLNMTTGTLYVLTTVHREGPLSMSEISKKVLIPKSNLTPLVDKLIKKNLVLRENDYSDRRIIRVRITEKGINQISKLNQGIKEIIREKLSSLPVDKLNRLADSINITNSILSGISDE